MGRMSVNPDKTVYQLAREENGLSREKASELVGVSASTLEKLENGDTRLQPDHVLAMADAYKRADLCNYYCSHECPIGQEYVPEVEVKDLPTITLEILAMLNKVEHNKERLIEICSDGVVSDAEKADFVKIKDELEKLSLAVDSLKLIVEENI